MTLQTSTVDLTERAAFTVNEFLTWARISRAKFYEQVKDGRIPIRKLGKKTLVLKSDAERWLNDLPRPN